MKRKVNILYLSRTSKLTGPENILIDIIKRLDKEMFSPVVVLPDNRGPFFKKLEANGIDKIVKKMPFIRVTKNPFLLLWFSVNILISNFSFFYLLRKRKVDIVVCNSIQEALFLFLPVKIMRKRLIICFKNILDRKWKKKLRAKFCDYFADSILAVSEKALEDYTLFCNKNRAGHKVIKVVYDGIDCMEFKKDFKGENVINREKNVIKKDKSRSNEIIIVNIGNLTELKGQMLLLEALSSHKIMNLDIMVLLIGDVYHESEIPYKKSIEEYILKNNLKNKVFMLGYKEDVRDYLNEADIMIHCPVKDDALPRVILEAFCSGTIVVATRVGGIPEMISDNYNGFLCEVDKDSLADRIFYVCSNLNKLDYIRKNAQETVQKKFSLSNQVMETEEIYREILGIQELK